MKILLALLLVLPLLAADISGNWTATAEGPGGAMERTFSFKVSGETLTGETVSSFAGKSEIREGTVKGDRISFVITIKIQGEERTVNYKGRILNDKEIAFTADIGGGNTIEWAAKQQK